ncbi:hypothetical protein [Anaerocolumna jejuensis]|uniref:hypothetical protein n=1 Tax=Anaerocolumna jejuensis TaxID=259063 RepID=UPI00147F9A58|nr:hypothetical protein [Anaerocolumna jejuensis]
MADVILKTKYYLYKADEVLCLLSGIFERKAGFNMEPEITKDSKKGRQAVITAGYC